MYENIHKYNGKYIIEKTIYGQHINYGKYETLNEAIKQRDLLIKHDWIKNKSTGYHHQKHFERYIVEENSQNKYIVKNKSTGKCYGAYKSKKYAKIVKKILPYFNNNTKIETVEKKPLKNSTST